MANPTDEKTTCYCDAPDHEMCWDGLVGLYDPNCSCCKDTQQQLNLLTFSGALSKLDGINNDNIVAP